MISMMDFIVEHIQVIFYIALTVIMIIIPTCKHSARGLIKLLRAYHKSKPSRKEKLEAKLEKIKLAEKVNTDSTEMEDVV